MWRPAASRRLVPLSTVVTAVALVLVGALSASCSGDDSQARPAPTTAESQPSSAPPSSPRPDPTPEPPALPAAAQGSSVASAKAFVRHYVDLLNYATNTGDASRLRAVTRDCEGCDRYADLYDRTYRGGGWARTRGWRVTSSFGSDQGPVMTVIADVAAAQLTVKESKVDKPKRYTRDTYQLRFELQPKAGTWRITSFAGR